MTACNRTGKWKTELETLDAKKEDITGKQEMSLDGKNQARTGKQDFTKRKETCVRNLEKKKKDRNIDTGNKS